MVEQERQTFQPLNRQEKKTHAVGSLVCLLVPQVVNHWRLRRILHDLISFSFFSSDHAGFLTDSRIHSAAPGSFWKRKEKGNLCHWQLHIKKEEQEAASVTRYLSSSSKGRIAFKEVPGEEEKVTPRH